jgi:hypothetical protein
VNDVPESAGGHSDTLVMMRATTDPAPSGTPTPVASVGAELEQYRFVIADIKKTLNAGIAPSFWYSPITQPSQTSVTAQGARVFRNSSQSIPISAQTAITLDTVRFDTGVQGIPFWNAGQPTRLTAPVAGIYEIGGFGEWAGNAASGVIALIIRLNNSKNISYSEIVMNSVANRGMEAGAQYQMAQGDYVELTVFQAVNSPLNIINPEFWMVLLNPSTAIAAAQNVGAILVRRTGDIAAAAATPFVPLGSGVPVATHAIARSLVTKAVNVTSMYIRLASALAGGGTAQFRLNVNGTTQNGLSVTIASGSSTGNAIGLVSISDGDFVSLEVTFAGGTVAATIRSATMKYLVP